MVRLLVIILATMLIASCGVRDLSQDDLKSPCVAIKGQKHNPCVKNSPLLNSFFANV